MKKAIGIIMLVLFTISLHGFLLTQFSKMFDKAFDECRYELAVKKNYKTVQQAVDCAFEKSPTSYILSKFLWVE